MRAIMEIIDNRIAKQVSVRFHKSSKKIGLLLTLENKEK
jgi:hypothetical protein